jgi:hypothetical protein
MYFMILLRTLGALIFRPGRQNATT